MSTTDHVDDSVVPDSPAPIYQLDALPDDFDPFDSDSDWTPSWRDEEPVFDRPAKPVDLHPAPAPRKAVRPTPGPLPRDATDEPSAAQPSTNTGQPDRRTPDREVAWRVSVMQDERVSWRGKLLCGAVSFRCWQSMRLYASHKTVADWMGTSASTARRATDELVTLGYLTRQGAPALGGTANYRLTLPV